MIFLSAQPDDFYFLWQLQLQLYNFNCLGIRPENIHVLIGYHPDRGLSREFSDFIDHCRKASFFTYPDNRPSKTYLPSIRPHIIAQHFDKHPRLQKETIFYHDSDVKYIFMTIDASDYTVFFKISSLCQGIISIPLPLVCTSSPP